MRGLRKKAVALAAAAALVMTSLVGCAGSVDNSEVVATVGESEITAGVANFYIRFQQASMEGYYMSYLGEDMWTQEVSDGVTYEESIKDSAMESLQQFYILRDHMEEYNVCLTDEEKASIEEAVKAFDEANADNAKKKVSGDKAIVQEVLELMTISEKMYDAMIADVDTEVSDEEAAQKAMQYVLFATSTTEEDGSTTEMSEEEIATAKANAEDCLAKAKENGSLEAYAKEAELEAKKQTFDAESTSLAEEVIKAADALGEGEFAEVIETDSGYYVVQLTSLLDREATDTKKESIVKERQNDKYQEIFDAWKEATEITVHEKVWKKISLQGLGVTAKTVEEADESEDTTDVSEDTASETEDTASETEDTASETEDTASETEDTNAEK